MIEGKIQIFGLSLHDYFAGQALAGIAPLPWSWDAADADKRASYVEDSARTAYAIADAMMRERDPEKGTRNG